jgi:hypothetical protein
MKHEELQSDKKRLDGHEAVLELPVRAADLVMTTLRARRAAMLGNVALDNINN